MAEAVVAEVEDRGTWTRLLESVGGHPLQGWGWGELKATFGWSAHRVQVTLDGTLLGVAQVLVRRLPFPFRALCYVPRGPVLTPAAKDDWDAVLEPLSRWCRRRFHPVVVTVEPGVSEWSPPQGAVHSAQHILYDRTALIDLSPDIDTIVKGFKSKTRQYARKAAREGVSVRRVTDESELPAILDIYHSTAERDGFLIHADAYYETAFRVMGEEGRLYVAEVDGAPVCFLWLAVSGAWAFELWGGMVEAGERLRANYALKDFAIRDCKATGVSWYDLNGLLGEGITHFKHGFAPGATDWVGTWDIPASLWYRVWVSAFPALKRWAKRLRIG